MARYFDTHMQEIDREAFRAVLADNYRIQSSAEGAWVVDKMQLQSGDVTLRVWLNGQPAPGMFLRAYWPDGYADCEFKWQTTHQHQGWAADFTLNEYMLPHGPYWVQLLGAGVNYEMVDRIGMMHASEAWPGVNHIHADIWYNSPEGEGGDMGDVEYDLPDGFDMDTHFRHARVEPRPGPGYHVTKLTAVGVERRRDDKMLTVTFKDSAGSPVVGARVKLCTYGAWERARLTDEDGQICYDMGDGDDESWWYAVPGEPAHAIAPFASGDLIGDTVVVGVVKGRWDWLNIEYQWSGDENVLPGKPELDNLRVGATEFYVDIVSENADSRHYTLDGPDGWNRSDEAGESALYVSGLVPSTAYHLKVWGRNEAGDGPDEFLPFTTLAEDEPPPVPDDWNDLVRAAITALSESIEALEALLVEE